jgi:ribosome-binding protein aMBF1 (putative translation factor)
MGSGDFPTPLPLHGGPPIFTAGYNSGKPAKKDESEVSFLERSCWPSFAIPAMNVTEGMAANVRRARHAGKMTQEELADRAGLSARYLGSIERAEVSATITVLERLAGALGVEPCELIRPTRGKPRRR